MTAMRYAVVAATALAVSAGAGPAQALGGGGIAPGGPLSGSIQPACNGYNMDGTLAPPGRSRKGCVDQSARSLQRMSPATRDMESR